MLRVGCVQTSGLWGEEAHLALSAILVDTLNLDATSGRTRAVDTEMVHALLHQFPALNRDTLFTDANEARFNVHHLSLPQLLRKDYKQVKVRKGVLPPGLFTDHEEG